MKFEQEDFDQWLAHPITEAFYAAMKRLKEKAIDDWTHQSWHGDGLWKVPAGTGDSALELRAVCRARFDCLEDVLSMTTEDINDDDDKE